MQYVVEFEVCALVFLLILTQQFFEKRPFPNMANKLFGFILVCAIADLALDIISAFTIEKAAFLPIWVNLVTNAAFYSLQLIFPVLAMIYAMLMAGIFKAKNAVIIVLLLLPGIVFEIMLLLNPLTNLFFYIDASMNYIHGPWFKYLYYIVAFYMSVIFIFINIYRRKLQENQYKTIFIFIIIIAIAIMFQFYNPRYLLTGVAIALAITTMYFTIQNPKDMLDVMTGVFNYEAMLIFLKDKLEEKKQFQLIAIDIGGMRRINNLFGMVVGNQVMIKVGNFLLSEKENTWVFRMVGTRFVIITYDQATYQKMLSKIEEGFKIPWEINGMELMLSATVRHFPRTDYFKKPEDVINLIDMSFSDLGSGGLGSTEEIESHLMLNIQRRVAIETALKEALENQKGYSLYFQPIYSVKEKRIVSAEALLRFSHPVMGDISPAEFIPIAEEKGLILRIDETVINLACQFIKKYQPQKELGIKSLQINLSAADFLYQHLPERLRSIVEKHGVDPSGIIFEVTETAAIASYDVLAKCMNDLIEKGFRFALDDFGTGYANIAQVVNLPFFAVKLDRSLLVPEIGKENISIVFEDTLRMFRRLGLVIVVEGVENNNQAGIVIKLEADYVQGFFYANPMPAEEFVAFIQKQNKL